MTGPWTQTDLRRNWNAVVVEGSPLGGPVLRLAAKDSTAEVALQGAQVLSWQPKGHAPVIWLSPMERLGTAKPVRGGTPVCWPWFANHPTDAAKPPHGFLRTRRWACDVVETSDAGVRVYLNTSTTEADRLLWPHAADVEMIVTLGETLQLEMMTRNKGSDAFALTQALHTYFAVGDISDVTVEGFDRQSYIDKLDDNARKRQAADIAFSAEVDRIYDEHTGAAVIVDRGLKRRIEITKSGSRSTVVWNPWSGKAARMGDMGPMGWRRMVCVETCNAGQDIVTIQPGGQHVLTVEYRVSALA
jgi:glucose-6-phosphate 1-epimerase